MWFEQCAAAAACCRYARTGKEARKGFEKFTQQFFTQRPTLAMVLLLVDCSIPPQVVDLDYAGWLGQQGLPFCIVFTKADKRKKGQPKYGANIGAFKQALLETQGFSIVPPCLVTSASSGMGKQELLQFVASLRVMFEQQQKQAKRQAKQPAAAKPDDAA
jgi:GTP-binding protein